MAEAEGSGGSDDACLFMSPEGELFLRHADGNVEQVEGFNANRTADDDEEDERARAVPRASGAKRALLGRLPFRLRGEGIFVEARMRPGATAAPHQTFENLPAD